MAVAVAALDAFEASLITNLLDRPRTAAGGGPHHANREQFHTDGRAAVVLAQLGRPSYGRCTRAGSRRRHGCGLAVGARTHGEKPHGPIKSLGSRAAIDWPIGY